jgi:hypothetical protein
MTTKLEWLKRLQAQKEQWEVLIAGLNETQIVAPDLADGWAIKDVMAHLMAWQQRSNARLEAALAGRQPQFPDWPMNLDPEPQDQPNQLNAWLFQAYHDQPWARIYHLWRDGFQKLLDQAALIPEEDLFKTGHYPWLPDYPLAAVLEGTYDHHQEHYETLTKVR